MKTDDPARALDIARKAATDSKNWRVPSVAWAVVVRWLVSAPGARPRRRSQGPFCRGREVTARRLPPWPRGARDLGHADPVLHGDGSQTARRNDDRRRQRLTFQRPRRPSRSALVTKRSAIWPRPRSSMKSASPKGPKTRALSAAWWRSICGRENSTPPKPPAPQDRLR